MSLTRARFGVLALAMMIAVAGSAWASPITILGTQYVATGSTENLAVPFTTPDAGITAGTYSGYVELTVALDGESLAQDLNDAFYVFADGNHNLLASPFHDSQYYQVVFDTAALVPFNPSRDAYNYIYYDVDAGAEVSPGYVPAYRADHSYTFVINTGTSVLSNLHFGVSDGDFADNTGAYQISVTQLTASVPEPGSLVLLGSGLVLYALNSRRRGFLRRKP